MNRNNTLEQTLGRILRVVEPTKEDWNKRFQIMKDLQSAIESIESLRGATVEPFGSFVSNLFTRWGDLDISIELHNGSYIATPAKKLKQSLLADILKVLRKRAGYYRLQFISNARVPILKLETTLNISCDISINNLSGQMKSKMLYWLSGIDERFHDLILLVKEWAKAHHINDSKSGTLNSYCLSLLVVFHLQTLSPAILPPLREIYPRNMINDLTGVRVEAEKHIEDTFYLHINRVKSDKSRLINQSSLSELFVSFLSKFSDICSRASTHGVSPYNGQWEAIDSIMSWLPRTYTLFVEDPFEQPANTSRTVGSNQLVKISEAIEETHRVLVSPHQNQANIALVLVGAHISSKVVGGPRQNPVMTNFVSRSGVNGNRNGQKTHLKKNKSPLETQQSENKKDNSQNVTTNGVNAASSSNAQKVWRAK